MVAYGDWVCCGLGWLVVIVGLQWFVFVCDLVVGGSVVVVVVMAVVVGGGGCGCGWWWLWLWVVVETRQ